MQLLFIALPLKLFLEICVLADVSEHVQILFRSLIDCRSILRRHNIPFAVGRSVCQIISNTVKCIVLLCSTLVCVCGLAPDDSDDTLQSLHYGTDLGGICKFVKSNLHVDQINLFTLNLHFWGVGRTFTSPLHLLESSRSPPPPSPPPTYSCPSLKIHKTFPS